MGLYPYADRFPVIRHFPAVGRSRSEVLADVAAMADEEDRAAFDGRISGSIYMGDHEHYAFLNDVFGHFSHSNVLQRDVYPSATRFEGEIIAMTIDMLRGGPMHGTNAPDACGVLTSGGTESLMNPLLVYREWGRARGVSSPNVVLPTSAHPAFAKGAHYFGIELRRARLTDNFEVDVDHVRQLIDDNTVALVGTAGTYPHGVIDPIAALSDLAVEHGINLHVDGCLGGFILGWADDAGVEAAPFDFRLPGVTSISADTHKYGFALKGSSVLLYRTPELRALQYFIVADWSGGLYAAPGMSGSRSGGIIAATWASMVSLGRAGYVDIARQIFATAAELKSVIRRHSQLAVLGEPLFNVSFAAAPGADIDVFLVNDSLARSGWRLNGLQEPAALRFCVTRPNTQGGVIERFADALDVAVGHAEEHRGTAAESGAFYAAGTSRDAVASGMAWWMDMTQSVPSA